MIEENLASYPVIINVNDYTAHGYILTGIPAGNVPGSKNLRISCE